MPQEVDWKSIQGLPQCFSANQHTPLQSGFSRAQAARRSAVPLTGGQTMNTARRNETPRFNESFPLYTPAELAQALGITPDLLARWRARGVGPKFIREARNCIVYLRTDVDDWLRKRRRERLAG